MIGLINKILAFPQKIITLLALHYFSKILEVLFIIRIWSTWFHVSLILHPLQIVMHKFTHKKCSYLLLEINLVLIYQIIQTVINIQHKCIKMCVS